MSNARKRPLPLARFARTPKLEDSVQVRRFAACLRAWRTSGGHKISGAAKAFGVATSTWSHWESGRSLPTGDNLLLLAEFTGIALQHFICPNTKRCPFRSPAINHPVVATPPCTEFELKS